jgi:hypothetical protein
MKWAPEKIIPFVNFIDIKWKIEKLSDIQKKDLEKNMKNLQQLDFVW